MRSYASLHNHSEYSNLRLLDCTNKLENLVKRAEELNLSAIAITDHESLSGWIKAIKYQKALTNEGKSIKIILGDEIYLVDSLEETRDNYTSNSTKFYHFILLAKDAIGGKQLRQISSAAWENSFYTGKMERVPSVKDQVKEIISDEKGHLIALTACMGGELAYHILNNDPNSCLDFIDWCQDVFLPENFFLEMQPSDEPKQVTINQTIIKISEQLNIPYIITTDSHYLTKDKASVHEAYLKSRDSDEREVGEFYKSCYLMTSDEIHDWMDKQIGYEAVEIALDNTEKISDMIEFFDLAHSQIVRKVPVPEFEMEHSFRNYYDTFEYIKKFAYSDDVHDRYFLHLIENGWWEKEYKESLSKDEVLKMLERINLELEAVWLSSEQIQDKISNYYLTALYIENFMWDDSEDGGNSLVGPGRGSVAAFYVCYLIGLQEVNSIEHDIPYWRHLHASRPEMPDVDIDTEASARPRIIEATRKHFGYDKVLNICTFKTEGPKSAIATVARAFGISNDEAQYIKDLIPSVRGKVTPLHVMVYGDEDNKPNQEFISECSKFPGLLETAMEIEGLVSGRSIHASGVLIFETNFNDLNCMMKAPNKQAITQWDMDDSTYAGGLKYDYLTITNLDAMHKCMDLLVEYGIIKWQGSLKETYKKYLQPSVIDYDSEEMWNMAAEHLIVNLFQFNTQVGLKAIQKVHPKSLNEMGVANAVMRLAAPDGKEQPLDTYVRYKNNIQEWYDTMKSYQLTETEINIVEKYLKKVSGMATMQEEVMLLVMDNQISDFDMKNANYVRKSIAKKKKKLQEEVKQKFYESGLSLGTSKNLLDYIWNECITPQLGYSFSLPHLISYSIIAIQEMNLAYHYPIIYWNTANLIVDSASDEDSDGGSSDYGKIGVAIANMQKQGINIALPLVNEAKFSFVPDQKNNRIIYALKGMNGIGDVVAKNIVDNAPYKSIEDFAERMLTKHTEIIVDELTGEKKEIQKAYVTNAQMLKLIKGGCFTELHNQERKETMNWYLSKFVFSPIKSLSLTQLPQVIEMGILPCELELAYKMTNFKKYVLDDARLIEKYIDSNKKMVKRGYHDGRYILDDNSMPFFKEHFTEESVVSLSGKYYVVSEKLFTKEVDSYIRPLKDWFSDESVLDMYNQSMYKKVWDKNAKGTEASWNMEALNFYDAEHELQNINDKQYGIVDFFKLPEEPVAYDYYTRYINKEKKSLPKYQITCIAGTVLESNKNRHTISLLTKTGVVTVKFNKGHFAFYSKRISEMGEDGKNHVVEESWLKRGSLLRCIGIRDGDMFRLKNYSDTIYSHTLNLITEIHEDGSLVLQYERYKQ